MMSTIEKIDTTKRTIDGDQRRPTREGQDQQRRRRRLPLLLLVPLLALVLALAFAVVNRRDDGSQATSTTSPATSASAPRANAADGTAAAEKATPTTQGRPTTPEAGTPPLANGKHPVYLTAVNTGRRTITVDVVQVLDPKSAQAATSCPEIASGEIDGYCIANTNARLRTLNVPATASLQVLNGSSLRTVNIAGLAAARRPQKEDSFFEITVSAGKVTSVKELYRA